MHGSIATFAEALKTRFAKRSDEENSAVSQQNRFVLLPLESQGERLQHPPVTTSPTASASQQPQTGNGPKTSQRILLFSIHRPEQQQQQKDLTMASFESVSPVNHSHTVRHRHLHTAPVIYHQRTVNKAHTMGVAEHMHFSNSSHSQLLMNRNGSWLEPRIFSSISVHRHRFPHESQSERQLVKFTETSSLKQKQPPLLELALLNLSLPQTKTPTMSNKEPLNTSAFRHSSSQPFAPLHISERLSGIQPKAQRRKPRTSHLPISVIPTAELNHSALQFAPKNLSHSNILARTFPEPVLKSLTTSVNDAFLDCCKRKNIDARCEPRCNFDILDRRVLTAMFVGSDPCPPSNGRNLLSCAAQDLDHTNCCREHGVQQTAARDKCLTFCQMTPEANFQADVSMLPCWSVLKEIKQCFRLSLIEKHNNKNAE
ncbi:unnamed protein product [Litomosoides sigmodontis]|uniref:Domain of unknown function DB domain-containing protein n=1 Tax=Litomosoides sigmodontis TaxID=42156 RepID=A0A3P6T1Z0_LITSI|nr:unnamed protein product [Litomosoides sigmodontis]